MRLTAVVIACEENGNTAGLEALIRRHFDSSEIRSTRSFSGLIDALSEAPTAELVVLDSNLVPSSDGGACWLVRQKWPDVRLVVRGRRVVRPRILAFIAAGAHGFIPEDYSQEETEAALKCVLGGGMHVPALAVEHGPSAAPQDEAPSLDEQCLDGTSMLLPLLAQGMSNKRMANELGVAPAVIKARMAALSRILRQHVRKGAVLVLGGLCSAESAWTFCLSA